MHRVRLKIAYDGTQFAGWQQQKGQRTVEGELNRALCALTKEEISVIGASRTDSGVHAEGNIAVFDTDSPIPPERMYLALNRVLPDDVRAVRSECCAPDWHPRHTAAEKTYLYRIWNAETASPTRRLYAYHCPYHLELSRMRAAAERLLGEHDFTSFSNPASQVLLRGGSAVREIYELSVLTETDAGSGTGAGTGVDTGTGSGIGADTGADARMGTDTGARIRANADAAECTGMKEIKADAREYYGEILIRVRGSGFLYHMVRIIAGTLVRAGMGQYTPEDIDAMLAAKNRTVTGPTAPANGLCLYEIRYANERS